MSPPLPSATSTWHNDTYDTISPLRPELSAAGKTVIITGAGSGIGQASAVAFAEAGAAGLVLLGRTEASLKATAALASAVPTATYVADTTSAEDLRKVAAAVGTWDVLVLSAGYVSAPSTIASSSADDWWQNFETNTKGNFLAIQAFLPSANAAHAAVLGITTGCTALPPAMVPGMSAYMASKLAQTKLLEYLAAEQPNIFAATVHPGMVETEIFTKSGAKADALPMDRVDLPGHFMVWVSSPEAAFLNGRSLWVNWDVDELKAQAEAIRSGMQMTSGINGWPYPNM